MKRISFHRPQIRVAIAGVLVVALSAVVSECFGVPKDGVVGKSKADRTLPKKLTPEEKAKRGAELYESPDTRKEGVSLLRQAAGEGSAFALARLSALYYLGEGGFRQDYGMALRLMKSSVAKGFPAEQLPIKEVEEACKRGKGSGRKHASDVRPGYGYPGRLEAYTVGPAL